MPHTHRFHVPGLPQDLGQFTLPPEEAHHAAQAARVRVGDAVELFDGEGRTALGQIEGVTKREVTVAIASRGSSPPPAPELTLAVAWLHRDRAIEHVIVHGTELGVHRFVFFRAAHSQKAPKDNPKWRRWAVEACKQCGRNWLPRFETRDGLVDVCAAKWGRPAVLDMESGGEALSVVSQGGDLVLFVGPEGDFSAEERSNLREQGAVSLSLGSTTFRSEVAAVVGATLIAGAWGRLGPG